MQNVIRVLHVFGELNRCGAETMIMNIYRNIDKNKIQFDFIIHTTEECDYSQEIRNLGGRIFNIPKYTGKNHLEYKKAWNKFFQQNSEYKIIHGHVRSTAAIYLKIAKKYGLKAISHSHSTSSGYGFSATIKNILQYRIRYIADYFIACSKDAGIWLFGRKICNSKKFFILRNAIDVKSFTYNEDKRLRKRTELKINDKMVIGHVGRFHESKNHTFLIDIFHELYKKNSNIVLMLVGDGELKKNIKNKVSILGLDKNVIFTGIQKDISGLLQAMDIFIFPSLYEGLGMSVIEAQASGLQCIVSDNIPKEAFLSQNIKAISLNSSISEWVDEILTINNLEYRKDIINDIKSNGYDIEDNINFITKFYTEIEGDKHEVSICN